MGKYTRIYNRFKYWSIEDCRCEYCVNYPGKDEPCPLEVCCCAEERREAFLREYGAPPDEEAIPCRE